jgi:DNA-3-methyladenine glycosylase
MFPGFLTQPVDVVAKKLLGCFLERTIDGQKVTVRIVETEAYDQEDTASHAYGGKTPRNQVMFGEYGHLYVYFTYGMHYCCNIVTGQAGYGSGVLIRAVEPIGATEFLKRRRGTTGVNLTNGPAKLCQALMIDQKLSGHDLRKIPLRLLHGSLLPGETIAQTTRIGITKAVDTLRRYYITNSQYVSKSRSPSNKV